MCEFRFSPETAWDLTIPGLLYEKIREKLPLKEERVLQETQISEGPAGEALQEVSVNKILVFLSEDRQCFAQIGDRRLTIHTVKPYITWTNFKPVIAHVFSALVGLLTESHIRRIGLRYVNRIEIPGNHVELIDYFNFGLRIGKTLTPREITEFIAGSVFPFADRRDACRVQTGLALPKVKDISAFLLDLDYFLRVPDSIQTNQVMDWIENAHTTIEEIFEGCITDHLREIFQEIKE